MNESFLVRLRRNGRPWPIDTLDNDGVVLSNERDAFPRSLTLEFWARSDITAYRMNQVREAKGWEAWRFDLTTTLVGGNLRFQGVDERSLPGGYYWIRLEIADLDATRARIPLNIQDDQVDVPIDVDVQPDPRVVKLTEPVTAFDPEILRVFRSPSEIDGLPVDRWLASSDPRADRKACLLNLMAKLRTVPTADQPLIADVNSIFFVGTERVYCQVDPALFTRLQALAADDEKPFYYEGNPLSPTHLKLLEQIEERGWGKKEDYALHSFRQEGRPSMQIVVAKPSLAANPYYGDFDIDLGNPLEDVEGFVIHIGELAFGGDTDHLDLRKQLAKGATGDFLYYTVA